MDDNKIIELFFARNERALSESQQKYGRYIEAVAKNILGNREDAEEVSNDTWLRAWNSIPPENPKSLKVYLGTLARNLSFDRYRRMTAEKRGGCEVSLCLEEAEEFLSRLAEGLAFPIELTALCDDYISERESEKEHDLVQVS